MELNPHVWVAVPNVQENKLRLAFQCFHESRKLSVGGAEYLKRISIAAKLLGNGIDVCGFSSAGRSDD